MLTRNYCIVGFDFLGTLIKPKDEVVFCKNNKLYTGTISHFTKFKTAISYIDDDDILKCVWLDSEKIIKV